MISRFYRWEDGANTLSVLGVDVHREVSFLVPKAMRTFVRTLGT